MCPQLVIVPEQPENYDDAKAAAPAAAVRWEPGENRRLQLKPLARGRLLAPAQQFSPCGRCSAGAGGGDSGSPCTSGCVTSASGSASGGSMDGLNLEEVHYAVVCRWGLVHCTQAVARPDNEALRGDAECGGGCMNMHACCNRWL